MSRIAAVIKDGLVENIIEIAEGVKGDSEIQIRNAIEITNLNAGIGWVYEKGKFIAPPKTQEQLDSEVEQVAKAETRSAAEDKLLALGLTTEDLKALLG
jgi:hypothetical protein